MSTAKGRRGVYEADVEQYLKKRVEESGGSCDLIQGRGWKGCEDALVTWPRDGWAQIHRIEVKTVGGALDPSQINHHKKLKRLNCHVRVIWTKQMVDEYVAEYGARPRSFNGYSTQKEANEAAAQVIENMNGSPHA